MAFVSNGTTILDAGAFSVNLGSMVHIKTLTASSSANLSFVHGSSSVVFNSTYPIYIFKFSNIHLADNNGEWGVNYTTDGTNYNVSKTSTYYYANHKEDDSGTALAYTDSRDSGGNTGIDELAADVGADADQSTSGQLMIFNPSSTTFVKHYIATTSYAHADDYIINTYIGGYGNTTSAITGVRFSAVSGNIDSGTIKLYGLKDS